MEIRINDHIKVFVLQEELNILFPYLKLEFFSTVHKCHGNLLKKLTGHSDLTLADYKKNQSKSEITISPDMTVKELEQKFHEIYGLEIKLFRKSGKLWLETTVTDSWTLEQQNSEGEALSRNC